MFTRTALRASAPVFRAPVAAAPARFFSSSPARLVKIGEFLPEGELLQEGSPGNKVDLRKEAESARNMLIIGVPAAFSPACSSSHIPSYIQHPKTQEFDVKAVVSVNDAFVMKAWKENLDPTGESGIRFLADPSGEFTKALDLTFDSKAIFGNDRSKRYAIIVEDGKVVKIAVEPDNTGTAVSLADKVLA
ncbi:Redoxin [Pseudoneurospora amorphoporcata]|uniref:Redoxin n=1 Tax=Pseudoneurospora amorphoporcata TaxID=241081 RepID=A0AAN6SDJ3_9PEZI|nr:Redoxin [Pseudoneurospora amorphoporcata]